MLYKSHYLVFITVTMKRQCNGVHEPKKYVGCITDAYIATSQSQPRHKKKIRNATKLVGGNEIFNSAFFSTR